MLPGPNKEANKRASARIAKIIHKNLKTFLGISCFDGTFTLKLKDRSKPFQASLRYTAYALQQPFKEEPEWLQKQQIIVPYGVNGT